MAKSFNYSKWDNIELSDDESDLHPNIDKDSWFRLKHRTRLEREEREDVEVREYTAKNTEDQARIQLIQAQLRGVASGEGDDAEFVDSEALEIELAELKGLVTGRLHRIEEIHEKRKWNIDNICKVKEEKTIVNKTSSVPLKAELTAVDEQTSATAQALIASDSMVTAKASTDAGKVSAQGTSTVPTTAPVPSTGPEPANTIKRDRMAAISYNDYVIKHETLLEKYCELPDLELTKDFLFKHCDVLLHEHAQSYVLLSCLEDEMNGKHKRMKLVCRQSQILSHIHELGVSMKRDPRDVILPFFRRIDEAAYLQGFLTAVDDFIRKIQKRAIDKRREMDAKRMEEGEEEEEEEEEVEYEGLGESLGPGGLDPRQVLKALPKALRQAFESQDLARLQRVLGEMDPTEAKFHMKRCVDSGLWVAKDPSIFEEGAEDMEEGEEEEDGEGEGEGDAMQSEPLEG
jgi:cell division cycle protein 37